MSNIIHFPIERTRPGVTFKLKALMQQALLDQERALWCAKTPHGDLHVSPEILKDIADPVLKTQFCRAHTQAIKDFSLLGLYAVQSGQWQRKDLLGPLLDLQRSSECLFQEENGGLDRIRTDTTAF